MVRRGSSQSVWTTVWWPRSTSALRRTAPAAPRSFARQYEPSSRESPQLSAQAWHQRCGRPLRRQPPDLRELAGRRCTSQAVRHGFRQPRTTSGTRHSHLRQWSPAAHPCDEGASPSPGSDRLTPSRTGAHLTSATGILIRWRARQPLVMRWSTARGGLRVDRRSPVHPRLQPSDLRAVGGTPQADDRRRTSASGTYFSSKPLRADLSGLGENAVLVGKVRSRTAPPGPRQPATDNHPSPGGVAREPQALVIQTLVTRSRLGTPARVSGYWPSSCLRRCMAT